MMKNKKIKVVFAMPSFNIGGIEKHTLELFKNFDKSTFDLHLMTLFYTPTKPNFYNKLPKEVSVHKFDFKDRIDLSEIFKFFRTLKKVSPDVVVSSMSSANNLVRALKPFLGYKVIAREHNIYTDKSSWHFLLDHIFSYWTDKIVAVSKEVALFSSKKSKIPMEKFVVINNGVDVLSIKNHLDSLPDKEDLKEKLGLDKDFNYILNVARLKPQKNQPLLLESFKIFLNKNPDYKLLLIGDGQSRKEIEKLIISLDLVGRALVLGYRADVFDFYAVSDFFILTSDREGFPNVVVEAMAFGLPVIITSVSGSKELVRNGRNGYIVKRDPEDISEKMSMLVSGIENGTVNYNKNSKEMAEKFDIKNIALKYEKLFKMISK